MEDSSQLSLGPHSHSKEMEHFMLILIAVFLGLYLYDYTHLVLSDTVKEHLLNLLMQERNVMYTLKELNTSSESPSG